MKALVTGGAGYIGSHVVDELVSRNIETYVLVSGFRSENHPTIINRDAAVLHGDLRSSSELDVATRDMDLVFHLAAITSHYCYAFSDLTFQVNIAGLWNLRNACQKNGVQRIIFASSSFVYGEAEARPTPEDTCPKPKDILGISKLAGECLLQASHPFSLPYTILRLFTVYGPRSYPDKLYTQAVTTFIKLALRRKSIEVHGDGTQRLDFIYVEDVARAFCDCIHSNAENKVFNVGSGTSTSINDLVSLINQMTENYVAPHFNSSHSPLFNHTQADITNIKQQVGWRPTYDLCTGLKETIKFFKEEESR